MVSILDEQAHLEVPPITQDKLEIMGPSLWDSTVDIITRNVTQSVNWEKESSNINVSVPRMFRKKYDQSKLMFHPYFDQEKEPNIWLNCSSAGLEGNIEYKWLIDGLFIHH